MGAGLARSGRAEPLGHAPSLLHSLWVAACVCLLRPQAAEALARSARRLALVSGHGLKFYEAIGGVFHGWALIQRLGAQASLAALRAAVVAYANTAHMELDLYRAILANPNREPAILRRARRF